MPPINQRKKVLGPQHEAAARRVAAKASAPLWKGPEVDGVTFSMLNRFLTCRERFRVQYVEGWRTQDEFNHRIEYGNMWHVCEEAALQEQRHFKGELSGIDTMNWLDSLEKYVRDLCAKYPTQQEQIAHWWMVCRVQFPIYWRYWSKHQDMTNRTPLLQECVFDVPYKLPSGRTVRLRGKWDSVDLVTYPKSKDRNQPDGTAMNGIWIQENKSKGDPDIEGLARQMGMDLQSMIYVVALDSFDWTKQFDVMGSMSPISVFKGLPQIRGIRYNVIRRPLSGGKGSIKQHEATKGAKCPKCKSTPMTHACQKCGGVGRIGAKPGESKAEFYARLGTLIESASGPEWGVRPDENYFFTRFNVAVTQRDIDRFKRLVLDPLLDFVCDWYEQRTMTPIQWYTLTTERWQNNRYIPVTHWQHPFGCTNAVDEYGQTDVDNYLRTGSTVGLVRRDKLFEELV